MNKKVILCLVLAAAVVYAASPASTAPSSAASPLCNGYTLPLTLKGTDNTWYAWNSADSRCDACASGCKCTEAGKCDSCGMIGWTKNTAGTACFDPISAKTDSDTGLSNCAKRCADVTGKTVGCAGCVSTFGLAKNACTTSCGTNCATCDVVGTTATCKTCTTGHYLKAADKTCAVCPTTLTNCLQCDATGTKCVICNSLFYLVGDACVACPAGATKCSAKDTPTECADGYFFTAAAGTVAASCTACGTNARLCTSATVATVCNMDTSKSPVNDWVGVYLNSSGVCTACADTNAVYCNATGPIVCKPGYSVKGTACRALVSGCLTGHATDAAKCATCPTGQFISNGLCVALDSGVLLGCSAATAGGDAAVAYCTACKDGWKLKGTGTTATCQNCSSVVGCATWDTTGSTCACATCVTTTHISDGNTVVACLPLAPYVTGSYALVSNALVCKVGATACTDHNQCASGYALKGASSPYTCGACPTGCTAGCKANAVQATGTTIAANLPACTTCDGTAGYVLNSATPVGCDVCSAADCVGTIASCPTGYLKLAATPARCTAQHAQCSGKKSDHSDCSGCNTGYLLSAINTCTTCGASGSLTADCAECTSTTVCTKCSVGYLSKSGATAVCATDANCVVRDSTTSTCAVCKYGYNLSASTNLCVACADNACTFTCATPSSTAGGPGGPGGPGGKNSGSILTFALSALLALLVVLF